MSRHVNAAEAFLYKLKQIHAEGDKIIVRGMETKELTGQVIRLVNPLQRCYVLPRRNDDIFAKIAETMWMLAGRNDIEWLSWYLPRAPQYASDGKHWRGGYGPRLRKFADAPMAYDGIDQIEYVVNLLNKDPLSRQAVISIWDPQIDTFPDLDIPCNNWIHFYIRPDENGKQFLYMEVTQRSCDVLWGMSGIDHFSWSILHQMMAFWTGTEVGEFTHFISSLHLYNKHYKRSREISSAYRGRTIYSSNHMETPEFITRFTDFDAALTAFFMVEEEMRGDPHEVHYANLWHGQKDYPDDFIRTCLNMLLLYNMYRAEVPAGTIAHYLMLMPTTDFKLAAIEYLYRKMPILKDFYPGNVSVSHFSWKEMHILENVLGASL